MSREQDPFSYSTRRLGGALPLAGFASVDPTANGGASVVGEFISSPPSVGVLHLCDLQALLHRPAHRGPAGKRG